MNDSLFLVSVIYIGMWVYSAVALSLFITYLILNKNNNFGDSAPKFDEYSTKDIRYMRILDEVSSIEKTHLFADYGKNPYENIQHSIPEQLLKNSEKDQTDLF